MDYKFFVNWDLSGTKKENLLTSTCFFTNKNYKCKDATGVLVENVDFLNSAAKIISNKSMGGNSLDDDCLIIEINTKKVPFYVKEIDIFIHCPNYTPVYFDKGFVDLDFFTIYMTDPLNNEKKLVYHLKNEDTIKRNPETENSSEFVETYFYEKSEGTSEILPQSEVKGLFLLGKLVKTSEEFIFSPIFKFHDKNLIDLGKQYDINFIIEK